MTRRGYRDGSLLTKVALLLVALGVLLGGVFAWTRLRAADSEADATQEARGAKEAAAQAATETISLGEFLVNLRSDDDQLHYLQTEVSIVVAAPQREQQSGGSNHGGHGGGDQAKESELPPASHRYARDVTIEVLSSQRFAKLRETADRTELKALLQQRLDEALPGYDVRDVLFTAFVMQ